jgi:glycosyltransferase involved in cell wall biosynthesis
MRVLVVTTSFPRHPHDWAGRFVLDQAKALAARGHEVAVIAPGDAGAAAEGSIEGIGVRRVAYAWPRSSQSLAYGAGMPENVRVHPLSLLQLPGLLDALAGAVRREEADVVLAHWALAGLAAARPARKRGLGLAVTLNGSDLRLAMRPGPWRSLVRRGLSGATRVLVLGSAMAADVASAGLAPAAAVRVVPFGVDDELVARPAARGKKGRVVFVGRLLASKGLRELAAAVETVDGADLVCVGSGPLRAELEAMPRVDCLGALDRASLLGEVARASAVALPSYGEGLPITLLEAMALGRPVVATPVGAVPELLCLPPDALGPEPARRAFAAGSSVPEGEPAPVPCQPAGILVPVLDVPALADALRAVLGDPDLGARLGVRARERIREAYVWSRAAAVLERTLDECAREVGQ